MISGSDILIINILINEGDFMMSLVTLRDILLKKQAIFST
jgi:hypothetical protein